MISKKQSLLVAAVLSFFVGSTFASPNFPFSIVLLEQVDDFCMITGQATNNSIVFFDSFSVKARLLDRHNQLLATTSFQFPNLRPEKSLTDKALILNVTCKEIAKIQIEQVKECQANVTCKEIGRTIEQEKKCQPGKHYINDCENYLQFPAGKIPVVK